tara:strand:- start:791 stop:907 length:117 start_codon:yes stop_codon:yes gene_type:complete
MTKLFKGEATQEKYDAPIPPYPDRHHQDKENDDDDEAL